MRHHVLLRVLCDDAAAGDRLADALRHALTLRGVPATVERRSRGFPGLAASAGVRDPDGTPRWLAPLSLPDEPESACMETLHFLERWGFVPRDQRGQQPQAA